MANYLIFNQNGTGLGDTKKIVVNRDHVKYVSYIATNKFGLKLNSGSLITIQLSGNEAPAVIDNINHLLKANPSGKDLEVTLPAGITIDSSSSVVAPSSGATSLFDLNEASATAGFGGVTYGEASSFQIGSLSTDFGSSQVKYKNILIQNNDYGNNIENCRVEQSIFIGFDAGGTGTNYPPGSTGFFGQGNVCIGDSAMDDFGNVTSPSSFNQNDNTAIGFAAGGNTKESRGNTFIGARTASLYQQPSASTAGNNTCLGYQAAPSGNSAVNEITLGNSSVATLRCAVTSITSLSDERDKKDITDLAYGLDFIESLNPKQFTWDNRPEKVLDFDEEGNKVESEVESANKGKKDFGFIAQEVKTLDNDVLRLVYDENPDKLEMSYGKLVPILVKAVKELSDKVKALEAK